jgi:hypothetical protein
MSKEFTFYVSDELHVEVKSRDDLNLTAICEQALYDAVAAKPEPAEGTRVTATDLTTGYTETVVVVNDYNLICDGTAYVASAGMHGNGTHQLTIKGRKP